MTNHPQVKSNKVTRAENNPKSNKWDAAISDAERQLARINQRAAGLRQIIADFKRMRKQGTSWPGEASSRKQMLDRATQK